MHPFWMLSFSGSHRSDLLPVRIHHRHLGRRLREAPDHSASHHHAAHLPRRDVLFDRRAAAFWRTVTLFNPIVYLVSGFRWSFYESADVGVELSLAMTLAFLGAVHRRHLVDLQDRLSAEELSHAVHSWTMLTSACVRPWPAGSVRWSTLAPRSPRSAASLPAFSAGMMGSMLPDRMSTGFPARSACGADFQWHHGAEEGAAGERLRMQQQHGGGDVGAVREPERHGRIDRVGLPGFRDESCKLSGALPEVVFVEHAFRQASEESRRAVLEHLAARRQQRRTGAPPCARARSGRSRRRPCRGAGGAAVPGFLPPVRNGGYATADCSSPHATSGSCASMSRRFASRNGGSLSAWPRLAGASSISKPGPSVAISNRTPPGSRK